MRRDEKTTRQQQGTARVLTAERRQVELRPFHLEGALPADHRARAVWEFVEGLDLSGFYQEIAAVEGNSGRPAIDPRILLTLWLFAILEGVGSARAVERLCSEHLAYQWICGGVGVNHHTLSDFRVRHGELLDDLLTQSVATLVAANVVELSRVAQDGMKVRASAGAGSFRRAKTLRECLRESRERVRALKAELEDDPGATSRREQAARERATREREERVKRALELAKSLQDEKDSQDEKRKVRTSTTDPDARVMKMGDGGFRPAYNVQFATDTASQVIVGVEVTTSGNDQGHLVPMIEQVEDRYGFAPVDALVDGGYVRHEDIDELADRTTIYAPVPTPRDPTIDPHRVRPTDSEAVAEWRIRMKTTSAKKIYKGRAATAECINAQARNRGFRQILVRGIEKATSVALWYALAQNLSRAMAFGLVGAAAG